MLTLTIDQQEHLFELIKNEIKISKIGSIKIEKGRRITPSISNLFKFYKEDGVTRCFINFYSKQINYALLYNILTKPDSVIITSLALKEYGVKLDLHNFFDDFRKNAKAIFYYMLQNGRISKPKLKENTHKQIKITFDEPLKRTRKILIPVYINDEIDQIIINRENIELSNSNINLMAEVRRIARQKQAPIQSDQIREAIGAQYEYEFEIDSSDVHGLTDNQRNQIARQIEHLKKENNNDQLDNIQW